MGFLSHFHSPRPPNSPSKQPMGPEEPGTSQKTPDLMRVSGSRAALPPQGMGCLGLNEGDLWKILSHNRQIFQASLAALE